MTENVRSKTFWTLVSAIGGALLLLLGAGITMGGDVRELQSDVQNHSELEGHPGIVAAVRENRESVLVLVEKVETLSKDVTAARAEQSKALGEILRRLPQ